MENKSNKEKLQTKRRNQCRLNIKSHNPLFLLGTDYLFAAASSAVMIKLDFPACLKY